MKVYVLYEQDSYVEMDGDVDIPSVVGVFSSVEKIAEFMCKTANSYFVRNGNKWVHKVNSGYPHDTIRYFEEFELDKGEE